MARGMGLTLTDNADADDNLFDNPWTLMSDSRAYARSDPLFTFLPKFINAHDMERLGWLDESDIFELDRVLLNNQVSIVVDIDTLSLAEADRPRLLKISDSEAGLDYYVEARERSGQYDGSLPGTGVLIHEVQHEPTRRVKLFHDPRNGPAADYADSVDDIWTRGESTELGGVRLEVSSETANGFRLVLSANENVEVFPVADNAPTAADDSSDAVGVPVLSDTMDTGQSGTVPSQGSSTSSTTASVPTNAAGGGGGAAWSALLVLLLRVFYVGWTRQLR